MNTSLHDAIDQRHGQLEELANKDSKVSDLLRFYPAATDNGASEELVDEYLAKFSPENSDVDEADRNYCHALGKALGE